MTEQATRILHDVKIDHISLNEKSFYDFNQICFPWQFKIDKEDGRKLGYYYNWLDTQNLI